MSRTIDLFLLLLIVGLGWLLFRSVTAPEAHETDERPIEATVRVLGDVPLEGLRLAVSPTDDVQRVTFGPDEAPRQVSPFDDDRKAKVRVPIAGSYRVAFGIDGSETNEGPSEGQAFEITERTIVDVLEVELTAERVEALRALDAAND